jgi:anti-sigma factor (TIGR02949 family)
MSTFRKAFSLLEKKETANYSTECKNRIQCLKALQLILDGEATPEQLAHFNAHIDTCLPCIEGYNLEVTVRQLLCDKIEKKTVPTEVIEAIKVKINESVV